MSTAPAIPAPAPRNGFAPVLNQYLYHWPRLLSGDAQTMSVLFINSELHAPRPNARVSEPLQWTRAITNEELAGFVRCTVRAIEIALSDLIERKVIERKRARGGFSYSIPFSSWPELPDRPSKVVPIPEKVQEAEEEPEEETVRPRGVIEAVFETPQVVKPGKRTRKRELPNSKSASWIQMEVEGEVPQQFYPYLCDGVLVVRVKGEVTEKGRQTEGEQKRNTFRKSGPQVPTKSTKRTFETLHSLLDDYCLHHHGTIPNDKLLSKIQAALGKATVEQFRTVCRAKMRSGKSIPMGLFVNLAEDARLAAETRKSGPAESEVSPTRADTVEITDEMVLRLLKSPQHPDNQAILDRAAPAQVARLKALLRRAQK